MRWKWQKPSSGIQAAARQARYELLTNWCRQQDILHLLIAHHGDDQAETILLRQEKDSGPAGLSGMAPGRAINGVRLLRPLLPRRRKDMEATLTAWQQPWLDDPSNSQIRFARTAVRLKLCNNEPEQIYLQELARKAAGRRLQKSRQRSALAAQTVRMHPAGFCWWDVFKYPTKTMCKELLAEILLCIGGGNYRPRRNRLNRLYENLINEVKGSHRPAKGHTLGGARILPLASGFLICRETGRLPPPVYVGYDCSGRWDRFDWRLANVSGQDLTVGPLGETGWRQIRAQTAATVPTVIRTGLPTLKHGQQVLAVPHLNFVTKGKFVSGTSKFKFFADFSPPMPLQSDGLLLV